MEKQIVESTDNYTLVKITHPDIDCEIFVRNNADGSQELKITQDLINSGLIKHGNVEVGDWVNFDNIEIDGEEQPYSTQNSVPRIVLDATTPEILVESPVAGGADWDSSFGAKIRLNGNIGEISIEAINPPAYTMGRSYLSPAGIFANWAGINGMPSSSGYTHRGAVVGLGYGNVAKREWVLNAAETIVAGVYGRASNSGTAPAFGGFFYDLYAGGLTLGKRAISGTKQTVYLNAADTMVIGYTSDTSIVYLPANPKEGQVVWVKQWWTGTMRVRPRTGHHIYDDNTENEYYDFGCGRAGMFVFTIGYITSGNTQTKVEAWLVSAWKW